jgi:hypothetical protein
MLEAPIFSKYFEKYNAQELPFVVGSGECMITETYLFDDKSY